MLVFSWDGELVHGSFGWGLLTFWESQGTVLGVAQWDTLSSRAAVR